MSKFVTVSIKKEIIEKVDEAIDSGDTTYSTRADLIQDAVRIRLRELGYSI